ncbi:DUF2889 domain-containing protein [Paraburkholderia agricolaris]|uniref:DUF2889 domain-containing protein n=1 Tax=Paraburkholderia agricolaris TaxID=2152888 RepID=UPI0038B9B53A
MPLSAPVPRRDVHHRVIDMHGFRRKDGLYDIEAHLVDTKPFPMALVSRPEPLPAGMPLHDLSVRVTIDDTFLIRNIEASSDATPYELCKEAESTLSALVGERIAAGWSNIVKQKLRGAASCTHLMEMMIPLGTTAFQAISGARRIGQATVDPAKLAVRPDSCYAYSRQRSVIRRFWPELVQPDTDERQE